MKAAVLVKQKKKLFFKNLILPKLSYGQVLVKMLYSGICGTQISEIYGYKGHDKYLPHLLGHEGCGIVLDKGEGVKKVKEGDKVILHWRKSNGIESNFPKFTDFKDGKSIGAGLITTFSEKTIVSENRLTKVDSKLDPIIATLLGCSLSTAIGIVNKEIRLELGQSVLITGAGSLGQSIIFTLNLLGASNIVSIDSKKNIKEHLLKLGSKSHYNKIEKIPYDMYPSFDAVIDTTGVPDVISSLLEYVKPFGKLVLTSLPKKGEHIKLYLAQQNLGKKIIDTSGGGINPDIGFIDYSKFFTNKKTNVKKLVSKIIKFKDINSGISDVYNKRSLGKIIIEF